MDRRQVVAGKIQDFVEYNREFVVVVIPITFVGGPLDGYKVHFKVIADGLFAGVLHFGSNPVVGQIQDWKVFDPDDGRREELQAAFKAFWGEADNP